MTTDSARREWDPAENFQEQVAAQEDLVNHPNHYTQYQGFEVIDVCEQLRSPDGTGNYNRGNAFKYLARAGWKTRDKETQDLEKAEFYIRREIERLQTRNTVVEPENPNLVIPCFICGERLQQDSNDPQKWGCVGRGHGHVVVSPGSKAVWHPSSLKSKDV